jgi:hypothetical protein
LKSFGRIASSPECQWPRNSAAIVVSSVLNPQIAAKR